MAFTVGQPGDLKLDATASGKSPVSGTPDIPTARVAEVQGADYEVADTTKRDEIPYKFLRDGQIIRTLADGKSWRCTLTPPSTISWAAASTGAPQPVVRSTAGPVACVQATWQKWINAYTAAAITWTLPAAPLLGDVFELAFGSVCSTYPVTVDGSGKLVNGSATFVNRTNGAYLTLMYDGTGWVIT